MYVALQLGAQLVKNSTLLFLKNAISIDWLILDFQPWLPHVYEKSH